MKVRAQLIAKIEANGGLDQFSRNTRSLIRKDLFDEELSRMISSALLFYESMFTIKINVMKYYKMYPEESERYKKRLESLQSHTKETRVLLDLISIVCCEASPCLQKVS